MTIVANTPYYNSTNRYAGASASNTTTPNAIDTGPDDKQSSARNAGRSASADETHAPADNGSRSATFSFMGKIVNAVVLDRSNLVAIKTEELPQDQYERFMEANRTRIEMNKRYLQDQYTETTFPDYSNEPRMKNYASITIGGKVIATIDNQGVVRTENDAIGAIITKLLQAGLPGENMIPGGPESAQFRAEHIAELLGGRVVKAQTAMTQREYNAMPPFEGPTKTVDYEGMKNDPLYAEIERWSENYAAMEQKRADYLAQQQSQ